MEPSRRTKIRIVVLGVFLPTIAVWALYFAFVTHYHLLMYRSGLFRVEYYSRFMNGELGSDYPAIDYIMLGDSTARTALNPTAIQDKFGINLALNNGSAFTAYFGLKNYLERRPPPKCVLFATQYNWKRNYFYFYKRLVGFWAYDFFELQKIWFFSRAHGVFPGADFNWLNYTVTGARYLLRIDQIPLPEIDLALAQNDGRADERMARAERRIVEYRGFQTFERRRLLPENTFFRDELHGMFYEPFQVSPSEDFYIRELARTAQAAGSKFIFIILPVAESEHAVRSTEHRERRNAHLESLVRSIPGVELVIFPPTYPRAGFTDFTHFDSEGAGQMTRQISAIISANCGTER